MPIYLTSSPFDSKITKINGILAPERIGGGESKIVSWLRLSSINLLYFEIKYDQKVNISYLVRNPLLESLSGYLDTGHPDSIRIKI